MYNISNEMAADTHKINLDLPLKRSAIRQLKKDVNKRYANGKAMVIDIQQCLNLLHYE
jgi:hypothetical protein